MCSFESGALRYDSTLILIQRLNGFFGETKFCCHELLKVLETISSSCHLTGFPVYLSSMEVSRHSHLVILSGS